MLLKLKAHRLFIVILFLALMLRLILLIWSVTFPLDINGDQSRYEDWAQTAHIHGLASTYEHNFVKIIPNTQPPGTLYLIYGTYKIYNQISKVIHNLTGTEPGNIQWVNHYLLHSVMRLPNIITDILMGVLLYLIINSKRKMRTAILAASLIWFNPITIYNSTIWGQTDSITTFFFLLAVYIGFRKKIILSILSYTISIYIKFTTLPFLPFYLIFLYFFSGKQWRRILVGVTLAIVAVFIATYPINPSPLNWLITKWPIFSRGELGSLTAVAFNFWWMVTCFPASCPNTAQLSDLFLNIPLSIWAYILFTFSILPVLYLQIRRAKYLTKEKYFFMTQALVALLFYMLLPAMHDRYLYPLFILFAAAVAYNIKNKKYLIIFCILSVLHFGNLLASWYPTRMPIYYSDILYSLIYRWIISFLSVITTIYCYQIILRDLIRVRYKLSHIKLSPNQTKSINRPKSH